MLIYNLAHAVVGVLFPCVNYAMSYGVASRLIRAEGLPEVSVGLIVCGQEFLDWKTIWFYTVSIDDSIRF